MAIVYLDVDDEITFAASRIRSAEETAVALVLPAGSRIGTSRINFRLLAREAQSSGRSLSIVCPEAAARALAASAGLSVHPSVAEFEAAQAAPPAVTAPAAAALAATSSAGVASGAASATPPPGRLDVASREDPMPPGLVAPRTGAPPSLPVVGGRGGSRRPRAALVAGLGVVAVGLLAAGVAGYTLLPSATVSLVVRPEPLGPIDLTVSADPGARAADPEKGIVPADRPTFDLSASGSFAATGTKVDETQATGSVRWENCDPTRSYRLPAGTVARTSGGVGFTIDETVFLPVAILAGSPPSITCQTRDVPVTAVKTGEAGNVAARTITSVPATYNSVVIRVTNPQPTTGGSRTETPLVTKEDVAGAVKSLTAELDAQLAAVVADPTRFDSGLAVFEDTASRTDPVPAIDPTTIVGQEVEAFELGLTSTGSVTVVDPAAVRAVAEKRLRAEIQAGQQLVDGSIRVDQGEPVLEGDSVAFPVTAEGQVVQPVDEAEIRSRIAGRSVTEAQAILDEYGRATIFTWPEWVTTIPTYPFRLETIVTTDLPTSSPSITPSPAGSQAP